MFVRWSRHAKLRFAERAVAFGINYGDIEFEIRKQKVKIKEAGNRYKTVFAIGKTVLTAVKIETKGFIHVLTLWESNEEEVAKWRKRK